MTRRELKRAARARLTAMKREARARVDLLPAVQRAREKKARRRALTSAVLLLLLLFIRCDCGERPAPEPPTPVVMAVDAGKPTVPRKPMKRAPSKERLASSERALYDTGTQRSPAWLDDFRMQVAARSPRLAQCFKGADRPGAMRWNVALNPESGGVSDHLFETVGAAELTAPQRECVQKVLSTPGYSVAESDRNSIPARVSLVIEF